MAEESSDPAAITGKIIEAMLEKSQMNAEKVAEAFKTVFKAVIDVAYADDDGGPMPMS